MGFQQRKKDYLQRLIEEFFAKIHSLINGDKRIPRGEMELIIKDCFKFFDNNFEVTQTDSWKDVCEKVPDFELLEQYTNMLKLEYELLEEDGDKLSLEKAQDIIDYVIAADTSYSWQRMVLQQDIKRLLLS